MLEYTSQRNVDHNTETNIDRKRQCTLTRTLEVFHLSQSWVLSQAWAQSMTLNHPWCD